MTSPVPEGTDEAVEAAARAIWAEADEGKEVSRDVNEDGNGNGYVCGMPDALAAVSVAAAAPYVAAKALRDAAYDLTLRLATLMRATQSTSSLTASSGAAQIPGWLNHRADAIERTARAAGKDKTDER